MKKLFGNKRITKEKIIKFLDSKGFYVVLAVCVVVIGITAVLISRGGPDLSEGDYENQMIPGDMGEDFANDTEDFTSDIEDQEVIKSSGDTSGGMDGTEQTVSEEGEQVQNEESSVAVSGDTVSEADAEKNEEEFTLALPVFGEINFDFAMDKLVYSKTLDDWRTHSGIDIASSMGTPVKAAADGVVSQIKHDPRFGITIIVDHENGYKTVYCNLANDSMVAPNQKISQGDVLSSIGDTALFETAEPAHLHFEVLKDDIPVDPKGYLAELEK